MSGTSWYQTGFDSLAQEKDRLESLYGVDRFFMKPKVPAAGVFIDDDPFTFYEHSYKKDGNWDNLTCIARLNPDNPRCCGRLGEPSRYFVGMLTFLDCTPFTRKDGSVSQFNVKLYPAKYKAMSILQRKRQQHTSLVGLRCGFHRDTDKDPNTGSELTFTDPVKDPLQMFNCAKFKGKLLSELWDRAEANPEDLKKLAHIFQLQRSSEGRLIRAIPPLNYMELCAPKSLEEVTRILSGNIVGSGDFGNKGGAGGAGPAGSAGSGPGTRDIPF